MVFDNDICESLILMMRRCLNERQKVVAIRIQYEAVSRRQPSCSPTTVGGTHIRRRSESGKLSALNR